MWICLTKLLSAQTIIANRSTQIPAIIAAVFTVSVVMRRPAPTFTRVTHPKFYRTPYHNPQKDGNADLY